MTTKRYRKDGSGLVAATLAVFWHRLQPRRNLCDGMQSQRPMVIM